MDPEAGTHRLHTAVGEIAKGQNITYGKDNMLELQLFYCMSSIIYMYRRTSKAVSTKRNTVK